MLVNDNTLLSARFLKDVHEKEIDRHEQLFFQTLGLYETGAIASQSTHFLYALRNYSQMWNLEGRITYLIRKFQIRLTPDMTKGLCGKTIHRLNSLIPKE